LNHRNLNLAAGFNLGHLFSQELEKYNIRRFFKAGNIGNKNIFEFK